MDQLWNYELLLLEAMSYGLSCIASDIPANRDVGLPEDRFFTPGDVEGLAEKIREFIDRSLSEEEKRQRISIAKQYKVFGHG